MKFAIKSIVAAAAFVAVGAASAAAVTVAAGTGVYQGLSFTGAGTLTFSSSLLGALNTGGVAVEAYGGAGSSTVGPVGHYTAIGATAAIASLSIDGNNVVGANTTGGLKQTAVANGVGTGGSLVVTDLVVDITNKKVFGTIIGANNVGTLANAYLWDITGTPQYDANDNLIGYANDAIGGSTTIAGAGTYNTTFTGLRITQTAFTSFVTALGLNKTGKAALSAVDDFGVINSTIVAAVPEPSTYALMGLGLVGMSLVARRRAK